MDWPKFPITVKEYTMPFQDPLNIKALQSLTTTYIMGLNHMAWILETRDGPLITHFENQDLDNLSFAVSETSLHILK